SELFILLEQNCSSSTPPDVIAPHTITFPPPKFRRGKTRRSLQDQSVAIFLLANSIRATLWRGKRHGAGTILPYSSCLVRFKALQIVCRFTGTEHFVASFWQLIVELLATRAIILSSRLVNFLFRPPAFLIPYSSYFRKKQETSPWDLPIFEAISRIPKPCSTRTVIRPFSNSFNGLPRGISTRIFISKQSKISNDIYRKTTEKDRHNCFGFIVLQQVIFGFFKSFK
ncbi:uncharacterized protein LOC118732687, partial [Rhagoletis pomonella]|uniref:uncharacterized protein LOC118732687 n=1 Tax=Rhagoletis pomonella TaxID=28610 RepID=UPI001782B199